MLAQVLARCLLCIQRTLLALTHLLLFGVRRSPRTPERILLLRTCALGDFLFAVPSMWALRRRFPSAAITLLTTSTTVRKQREAVRKYVGAADSLPWLSFVVPSVIDKAVCFFSTDLRYLLREIRPQVKPFRPDATFILANPGEPLFSLLKKMIFLRLVGARGPVYGCRMRFSHRFLRKAQHDAGLIEHHVTGALRSVCEYPGMPALTDVEVTVALAIEPAAENWADSLWDEKGWQRVRVVAVAPGSVQPHKRWPLEKFVALGKHLVDAFGVTLVVVGTADDQPLGEVIVAESAPPGKAVSLAGRTGVHQVAALLRRCVLLVGNDGGAMHVAAAVGLPCVSIVPGLEFPGSIEPWNSVGYAVRRSIPCAPCYSFTHCPLGHNQCMTEIPVDDVLTQCRKILEQRSAPSRVPANGTNSSRIVTPTRNGSGRER